MRTVEVTGATVRAGAASGEEATETEATTSSTSATSSRTSASTATATTTTSAAAMASEVRVGRRGLVIFGSDLSRVRDINGHGIGGITLFLVDIAFGIGG